MTNHYEKQEKEHLEKQNQSQSEYWDDVEKEAEYTAYVNRKDEIEQHYIDEREQDEAWQTYVAQCDEKWHDAVRAARWDEHYNAGNIHPPVYTNFEKLTAWQAYIAECDERYQSIDNDTRQTLYADALNPSDEGRWSLKYKGAQSARGVAKDTIKAVNKQALRYNTGKPQYSQIDMQCLEPMVRVLEYGMKKYARNNWKKGFPETQLIDCLLRHVAAYLAGEETDPESGVSHVGHIQANAMFLGLKNNTKDIDNAD